MNKLLAWGALALAMAILAAAPRSVLANEGLRSQFEVVVKELNDDSFRALHAAIDERAMRGRIYGTRPIDAAVREAFARDFDGAVEGAFISGFPPPRTQAQQAVSIIGTIIAFEGGPDRGHAVVRYAAAGHRYSYHRYELARDRRGRLVIEDWFDYYLGDWFSAIMGDALVRAMPSKAATRQLLSLPEPTDAQLFQVGELLKAARDMSAARYWQIYDALGDTLRQEPVVLRTTARFALEAGNPQRLAAALDELHSRTPGDQSLSLASAYLYIGTGAFDLAIAQFDALQQLLGLRDGVTESFKASAALALGDTAAAQAHALAATEVEPTLELGWWSLLRAHTAAANYAAAVEALAKLEGEFDENLSPARLRQDRFLKVLAAQPEYVNWRESQR